MLVTFKSKAAAEVVMYQEHARHILDVIGKSVAQGTITAAETGEAIARLEQAIAQSKQAQASEESEEDNAPEAAQAISFATRAYPFLEMLRAANRAQQFILWGV